MYSPLSSWKSTLPAPTIDDLAKFIRSHPAKKISDVTVSDLSSTSIANGIYVFKKGADVWYIGKSTSRSFVERIPSHFDQRQGAWLATIPHKILRLSSGSTYASALAEAMTLEVMLLGEAEKSISQRLESMLRHYMKPRLNSGKKSVLPSTPI